MATFTEALPVALNSQWMRLGALGSLRVRYGIKLGLAGVLALYLAQVSRLEHPSWAVLTTIVMMGSQYVGSIAVKSIMRVVGTIGGALVGIWLAGDYASTPAIFLPVFFLVVAFAGYKFGQFPASQIPYAYFLVGLTTLSVVTYGVTDPADAWQIGLNRTLEILDGAISALLVTSLLWPRYAREEFVEAGRAALKTVSNLVSMHMTAYLSRTDVPAQMEQTHQAFVERLSVLKNLLQAGSRESTFFSARLSTYNAYLVSLTRLFRAALDLSRRKAEPSILDHLQHEIQLVAAAISEEFAILTEPHRSGEQLRPGSLHEALAALDGKVNDLHDRGALSSAPLRTTMALYGVFVDLRSLGSELQNIRSIAEGLPRLGQPLSERRSHWDFHPTIDWFWVKAGVKGGLVAVIAILLLKWINPPGSTSIPLAAWVFTILGRPFLRAGGTGDLRSFQNTFFAALILAVCAALLFLTTPFLADYRVMNFTLFLILFVFGFLTAQISGVTFWILLANLSISVFVGLNPEEPVASQTIIDSFLGLVTGMIIATVVGRLIWPVLPQRLLRDDLLAILSQIKALLSGDVHRERIQTQLAILPVEALQAALQIRIAGCSEEERDRIRAVIRALQKLATRTTELVSRRHLLPEAEEAVLRPQFERLEVEFKQVLDAFAECFRQGNCQRELPNANGALAAMNQAIGRINQSQSLFSQRLEAAVRTLDVVDRYHATSEALEECAQLIRSLQIQLYWGDYVL